ncbi:hypothetical protein M8997_014210 [Phyllobacterium sp. 21LDTY02-6]|jgi:hypothetical protein|nr:hypothetical protein [Phyllobacterium sp. 21LDTY02-6]MCO4318346.1 hypothetical protein [Phyllobacterium sp. 21LDTY02-6]
MKITMEMTLAGLITALRWRSVSAMEQQPRRPQAPTVEAAPPAEAGKPR